MPLAFCNRARRLLAVSLLGLALLSAGGCSTFGWGKGDDEERVVQGSPEQIYRDARRDLDNGNYGGAIQLYELLEARYPFSDQAKQGQLDLLYAYYKNRAGESAVDQADQFIRENPTHPRVDYAYYVRGLVYFESGANFLERWLDVDMAKRPPQEARKSFQAFQTLIQQYPKSPYAADARQRMVYLRNRLADYEVAVARYYVKRGAYVGALNRARGVIELYDGAPARDEALKIMAQAYRRLGLDDLAKVADDVRASNNVTNAPDIFSPSAAAAGLAMGGAAAGAAGSAAGGADASAGDWRRGAPSQAGRWEAGLGLMSAGPADIDVAGGSTVEIDGGGLGFLFGAGYNFTDSLRFGSSFAFDEKDYTARVVGDEPGESFTAKGSLDTMSLMVDVAYTFLTGPINPYVVGGVGWSWIDTNIASQPPEIGCWWHPWWGYVCTSWQDTRTVDGLAYEAGIGMRYDFSNTLAADAAYRMRWLDLDNATGSPRFDTLQLNLVWKF